MFNIVGEPTLEYVENTESDVFRYKTQSYYLVSGRWSRVDRKRSEAASRRETATQNRSLDQARQSQVQQNYGGDGGLSSRSYDSSRYSGSYNSSRQNELNRSYDARANGYSRYNNRSSMSR